MALVLAGSRAAACLPPLASAQQQQGIPQCARCQPFVAGPWRAAGRRRLQRLRAEAEERGAAGATQTGVSSRLGAVGVAQALCRALKSRSTLATDSRTQAASRRTASNALGPPSLHTTSRPSQPAVAPLQRSPRCV